MRPQEGDEVCTWDVLGKKLDYSFKDEIIDEINIFSAKLYLMLYDSKNKQTNKNFTLQFLTGGSSEREINKKNCHRRRI